MWQPESGPGQVSRFGLDDLQMSGFVSPSKPGAGGLIWDAGAIVQMPTDTDPSKGTPGREHIEASG